MSRDLFKMNMIASVQKLDDEDIETIQNYIKKIEEENKILKESLGIKSPSKEMLEGKYWETKEIKRLNNIINELEKWLKERYDICKKNIDKMEYNEYSHNFYQVANNVNADRKDTLNKLQELKGSEKSE